MPALATDLLGFNYVEIRLLIDSAPRNPDLVVRTITMRGIELAMRGASERAVQQQVDRLARLIRGGADN